MTEDTKELHELKKKANEIISKQVNNLLLLDGLNFETNQHQELPEEVKEDSSNNDLAGM